MVKNTSLLSGVGTNVRHQIIVANLIIGINDILERRGRKELRVLSETDVYYNKHGLIQRKNPDIILWKYSIKELEGINYPLLIIELTNVSFPQDIEHSHNSDILKMEEYLNFIPNLKECFLYNYLEKNIIKFSKNKAGNIIYTKNNYVAKFLDIQLKRYLHW